MANNLFPGLDGLRDAVVSDDVVSIRGGAGQRRVGPEERLTDATVHLDVRVLQRDADRGGLERLLVHGHLGYRAGLDVDLDGARERERNARRDDAAEG